MDLTNVVMDLLVALIGIIVPVIVAYVGYWAKRALKATEAKRYADALREYDAALYESLYSAAKVAVGRAKDEADDFTEKSIRPQLYLQAEELSIAFREKTGVRVDLNEERVDTLVRLAAEQAKRSWKLSQ